MTAALGAPADVPSFAPAEGVTQTKREKHYMSHRTLQILLDALESTLPAVKYLHEHEAAEETLKEVRAAISLGRAELRNTIYMTWHVDDVKSVRPKLTRAQCRAVLELAERTHDCNYGITWDHLEYAADDLFPKKGK
jgi:tRNA C32,U32 (ribose-2'-O)-methylase TrmJ